MNHRSAKPLVMLAMAFAAVLFAAVAVGCGMRVAAPGASGFRPMDKMWPVKQDLAAYNAASPAEIRAWVQQYGQDARTMPNLPDVAAATAEQRAAAADLLARTEAGTAGYADLAAAKAGGYTENAAVTAATDAIATMQGKMPMLHVAKAHPSGAVLDPSAPDMLMYSRDGDGPWKLVGVAYLADGAYPGPPPTPGGPITRWHYHPRMLMRHVMMHVFFVPDNDLAHAYAMNMDGM